MSKRKTREEYLEVARIDDRLVKQITAGERVVVSEGKSGEEHIVRILDGEGTVYHYEGEKGAEALVMVEAFAESSGFQRICYYEGPKDQERLVRVEHSNGHVTHYKGAKDEEFKHHVVFASGNTLYFQGPRKKERKYKQVDTDGTITFYRGEHGEEYYWACLHPHGEYHLFSGAQGREKLWRVVDPYGTVAEYDGTRDTPVRNCQWNPSGRLVHFNQEDNPLQRIKIANDELKTTVAVALESLEQQNTAGDCKENCLLVMGSKLQAIYAAAADLFEEAKSPHRVSTRSGAAQPQHDRIDQEAREESESEE